MTGRPAKRPRKAPASRATAAALIARLTRHGLTLAVAESCTGGLLGANLTAVPGASRSFVGGVIAYADEVKRDVLGVSPKLLADGRGSVSAAVVEAMAHGARERMGADCALAVSGIAGPTGGSKAKPVGTVWLAALGPGDVLDVHRIQATGGREAIRRRAVREALRLLASNLDEEEKEGRL